MKIDKRKNYILVLDTETTNTLSKTVRGHSTLDMSDVLFYDLGFAVIDKQGNVYEQGSYINTDIFSYESDLMQTAYYASKIPSYYKDAEQGKRKFATVYEIRDILIDTIYKYGIKYVCAHNARFDRNALNRTISYISKGAIRFFFPYNMEITWWDTMNMARTVIHHMPTYRKFCEKHNLFTATGRLSTTAQNLYRFISKNADFQESHTGLEDVLIEKEILVYCYRQKKAMRKELFAGSAHDKVIPTEFQRKFHKSLKCNPMLRIA